VRFSEVLLLGWPARRRSYQFRDGSGSVLEREVCVPEDHPGVAMIEQLTNSVQIDAGLNESRCDRRGRGEGGVSRLLLKSGEINGVDFTIYFDRPCFQTLQGHPMIVETADYPRYSNLSPDHRSGSDDNPYVINEVSGSAAATHYSHHGDCVKFFDGSSICF
jgi:hypothetical protein